MKKIFMAVAIMLLVGSIAKAQNWNLATKTNIYATKVRCWVWTKIIIMYL